MTSCLASLPPRPAVMYQLQLELAAKDERFEEARQMQQKIIHEVGAGRQGDEVTNYGDIGPAHALLEFKPGGHALLLRAAQ